MIKRLLSHLPQQTQDELKRLRFRRQIKRGKFVTDEPEIEAISELLEPGDFAIDVGANVGHYTLHLSQCVGPQGHVMAFEPMLATFSLLCANMRAASAPNVTLLNMAVSDGHGYSAMNLPSFADGLANYYRASISPNGSHMVMMAPLDSFNLPSVSLIKIDAEGHDLQVLKGADGLIGKFRPNIIIEAAPDSDITRWLKSKNYKLRKYPDSPNIIASPAEIIQARESYQPDTALRPEPLAPS